jgi:NADPH-dependent curcumin reductase CurA
LTIIPNDILRDWALAAQDGIKDVVEKSFRSELHSWPVLKAYEAKGYIWKGKYLIIILVDKFEQFPRIELIENLGFDIALEEPNLESKNGQFTVGEYVVGNFGWREYWISNGNDILKINSKIAPIQSFLGVLGITGLTAYVGLFKIGQLNEGKDTVFVSAASGAVGSVAAQIARIKGCHVIGSAGSEEKAEWLLDEAKLDYAFNYKNMGENNNISSELKKYCPEGIDLYFDNVGGKHLEAAIDNMKPFRRIVLCGMISQYNAVTPYALPNLFLAITNRLRLHEFIVRDHYDMLMNFILL